jgi:formiminoglutamate deiminase
MYIFAKRAWLMDGWQQDVRIHIARGMIDSIQTGTPMLAGDNPVDTLLPALANLHSHSFQRAMAGMTEYHAGGRDSFWTWRDLMYRFVGHLRPEHIQAIAAQVFMEMQLAGYAAVGEFHYLHHQTDGHPHDNRAETSQRIIAAAQQSGIGLTHLPVLYTYGGAGKQPLAGGQLRFGNSTAGFGELVAQAQAALSGTPDDFKVGIAIHSLRATAPDELEQIIAQHPHVPTHIHIAEQPQEVKDLSGWLGQRPVEWLLNTQDIGSNWCLVHATHMTQAETVSLARSGAVAGLCPITEANLGDGPFNGPAYLAHGGVFGIGSDSNVHISLTEELRTLEYSQRLRDLQRNVMVKHSGSIGQTLYLGAARGGAQALGRMAGQIATGHLADLVAINSHDPYLCALQEKQLFDGLCFAANDRVVTDLWSAGRHMVRSGRHLAQDKITSHFRSAITDLSQCLQA